MKTAGYAAVQSLNWGNDIHVYGVGYTTGDALDDASKWTDSCETLNIIRATQALITNAQDHGSNPELYTIEGGVLCLKEEVEP